MEDLTKDLKNGEEETPSDDDQSEEETSTESEEEEESSQEEEESEEEVKISKSELERLRKDADQKENYRKAVIRLNRKGRNLPGSDPEVKKKKSDDDEGDDNYESDDDKYVTKAELTSRDEKRAVKDACKNEQVALNWDEIVVFYQRPKDNSYDTQLAAIQSAHRQWKVENGITDKPNKEKSEAKKAKQDLSSDKGKGKGKEKKPTQEKKRSIIPKRSSMKDWYN